MHERAVRDTEATYVCVVRFLGLGRELAQERSRRELGAQRLSAEWFELKVCKSTEAFVR